MSLRRLRLPSCFVVVFASALACTNLWAEKSPDAPASADVWQGGPLSAHPLPFPDREKLAAIDRWLQEKAKHLQGAGLSVGFSIRDEEWMGSYGHRDVTKSLPVTPDTSFRIASVSKVMTAIAVLQEVERGRIKLDSNIRTYVPSFPRKKWPVRVRELLGHLGGISHYRNCRRECYLQTQHTTREALSLFQGWPLVSRPGEHYLYTSYGFNLLAAAVEKSAKTSFETYLRKNIFQRAGMSHSQLERNARPPREKARGYELLKSGLQPSRMVNISSRFGGGAVRSTQRDMLRFGRALLTGALLSRDTIAQMQRSMSTRSGVLTDYGMGIGVMPQSGRYVLAHAGGQPETSTYFLVIPAEGLVIFLATNAEEQAGWLRHLAEHLIAALVGDGSVRRQATGKDETDALAARAYFRTMSHGVAWFTRFGSLHSDTPGRLLDAFQHLNILLDEERIAFSPKQARADESRAADPVGGSTYVVAGSYMASVIAKHFGATRLRSYVSAGPFQFALDYVEACRALECPTGFELPAHIQEGLKRYQADWSSANTPTIRQLEIDDGMSATELRAMLEPAFAQKSMYPDLSAEILERMLGASRAGDDALAAEFLALAQRYYPNAAKVVFADAEQKVRAGNLALAKQGFLHWERLSTQPAEKKQKRLKQLKRALRKEGLHREAEGLESIWPHLAKTAKIKSASSLQKSVAAPLTGLAGKATPASPAASEKQSAP